MNFTVRPWLKIALAVIPVLTVYFQTIAHPFSQFDDPFIVDVFGLNGKLTFLEIITPGGGFYYRPLVNLSYWIDFRLWGMNPTFMHLENIITHLINVFLVYMIASRLPSSSELKYLPFLSALLFGLHPINTESVNWIPGRTDLFAGMFILFASYCLIRAIQEQSARYAFLAFAAAFAGTFAKETAIMFIPVALLVTALWPVVPADISRYKVWRIRFLHMPIFISSCLVSSILISVFVMGRGNNALSTVFEGDKNIYIRLFEAFGFYVKKTFLPLPLNAAITEIDPLYAIAGFFFFIVILMTFRSSGVPGIFLATAVLFSLPALLVATTPLAWTPFGERYLYIPSAFAVIGCLEFFQHHLVRWDAVKWFVPAVCFIIVLAFLSTFQRGRLWGDNLLMLENIIAQSPNFGVVRNEYGVLLKQAGRYEEAEKQFKIAGEQKNSAGVSRMIRLNLIGMKILGKEVEEVRRILLEEIGIKADGDVELLKLMNKYDETMLQETVLLEKRKKIVADIIETNKSLYLKTKEPFFLYRSGQLALQIGNNQNAANYFRTAWEKAPVDAYYREPARRLAEQLGAQ